MVVIADILQKCHSVLVKFLTVKSDCWRRYCYAPGLLGSSSRPESLNCSGRLAYLDHAVSGRDVATDLNVGDAVRGGQGQQPMRSDDLTGLYWPPLEILQGLYHLG